MPEAPVLLERYGRVGVILLNRPDVLNAFDRAMYARFDEKLAVAGQDPDIWTIVIGATGERAFSVGVDLKALDRDLAGPNGAKGYGPLAISERMVTPKPVIAAVHGHCIGEGLALALSADLVVAAEDAVFAAPEARVGINAVDLPRLLARRVPYGAALALLVQGTGWSAEAAQRAGLVHEITATGAARSRAITLAERISTGSAPLAVRAMKETLWRIYDGDEASGMAVAGQWRDRLLRTTDFAEGRRAFAEKRAPKFQAR